MGRKDKKGRRIRINKLLIIILVNSITLIFVSCLPGTGSPSLSPSPIGTDESQQYKPNTIKVAYMPNMNSASSLVTAKRKGYFDEVDLNVELIQFQGGPAEIAALTSGNIDIAQIGHGAHALAIEGLAKIFAIDVLSMADEIIGNKDKGVNTILDLKGKTIASTAGTTADIILNLVLAEAGLTQNEVNIVRMDASSIVTAMISGDVDACAAWDHSTVMIKNKLGDKAVVLGTNKDFFEEVKFPYSFITSEKYAKQNEDILIRFSQAILKAQDYRKENIEEVCEWVAEEIEVDKEIILQSKSSGEWLTGEFIIKGLDNGIIKDYYTDQQNVFIQNGRISKKVSLNKYILFDIMKQASEAYRASN
ncbi:MAG: ABC transporter substrate-binding protein [Clostridiaceae bacterium]|nr:ABC transporter substrate-binding protein [Clostridiaceae bacterium]